MGLNSDETAFIAMADTVSAETLQLLQQRRALEPTDSLDACIALFIRITNSWYSIHRLSIHDEDSHRVSADIGALFRILFEAWIQLAFILHDSDAREDRASLYLDYSHVERYKLFQRLLRSGHPLAEMLKSSAKYPDGIELLEKEFKRVKHLYSNRSGGTRNQWYDGSLRDLARRIGYEAEYDLWVTASHGCIHSSITGCLNGCIVGVDIASYWAAKIVADSARLCLDLINETLPDDAQSWVDIMTSERLGSMPQDITNRLSRSSTG